MTGKSALALGVTVTERSMLKRIKRHASSNSLASELSRLNADKFFNRPIFVAELDRPDIVMLRKEFRSNLERIHKKCQVTGVSYGCIASHIKPLASCNSRDECVDPANGLYLGKAIDEVFDKGWISFDDDGQMLISEHFQFKHPKDIDVRIPRAWLSGDARLEPPKDEGAAKRQQSYMRHHRYNVFVNGFNGKTKAECYASQNPFRTISEGEIRRIERNQFYGNRERGFARYLRRERKRMTGIVYVSEGEKR